MPQPICPYLGLSNDPGTVLEFPSERNYCHHARPIAPINLRHQRLTCLSGKYVDCPVYKRVHLQPLPEDLVLPSFQRERLRRLVIIVLVIVVLGGLGVGASALRRKGIGSVLPGMGNSAGQTGIEAVAPTASSVSENVFSLFSSPTSTPIVGSAAPNSHCEPPLGWVVYVVKPTDSLVRLSLLYKISVEQLQTANCLDGRVVLRPGETLFVPPPPTPTPTATRTATATRRPVIPPNPTSPPSDYVPPPSPTRPPPTATPLPVATSTPLPTRTFTSSPTLPPPPTPTNPPPPPTSTNPPPPPTPTSELIGTSKPTTPPTQPGG